MSETQENSHSKQGNQHEVAKPDLGKAFHDISKMTGAITHDAVNRIKDNAAQFYGQGLNQAKKFEKGIENRIQSHPIQSLLIVAGVGLVLGSLWNRR